MKMHYAGGLKIHSSRGMRILLRGWASCATGDAAYKIREQGNWTMDKGEVTCGICKRNILAAEATN